ncbi:MAG: integrin alpha, partial [Planctomycetota bacterium]
MLLPCVLALALPTPQLPSGTTVLARHVFETEEGADLGTALERVGDWDGDGVDDYAVGSPGYDFPALFDSIDDHGRVQVRSGADDQVIAETIQLYEAGAARVGTAIAGPFDSDQDGNLELAVATGGFDEVLILERGGPDGSWLDVQTTLSATLTSILVEQGFGQVLENLGDVTGDGVDDLGIGSPLSDRFELAGTILDAGAVRIVSGADWSTRALWSYGDDRAKFGQAHRPPHRDGRQGSCRGRS